MADDGDDEMAAATLLARNRAAAAKLAALGDDDGNEDESGLQSEMYASLKQKYDDLLAQTKEQDKTINF